MTNLEDYMLSDGAKRIVVIKDIKSNMIEEAIFVLKNGPVSAWEKSNKFFSKKETKKAPDFLLKEAEGIIDNYLKENKLCFETKTRRENRKKVPINKLKISAIINIALIGSLAVLVLLLIKLI
jgi:hypothetical protein